MPPATSGIFGEVTGECDGHKVTSRAGSWETGVDGAQPGVAMLADPRVGDTTARNISPGEAEDQATSCSSTLRSMVRRDLQRRHRHRGNFTPLEPDLLEHKSYAPGVGVVRGGRLERRPGVVELVKVTTGNPTPATSGPFVPCQG